MRSYGRYRQSPARCRADLRTSHTSALPQGEHPGVFALAQYHQVGIRSISWRNFAPEHGATKRASGASAGHACLTDPPNERSTAGEACP